MWLPFCSRHRNILEGTPIIIFGLMCFKVLENRVQFLNTCVKKSNSDLLLERASLIVCICTNLFNGLLLNGRDTDFYSIDLICQIFWRNFNNSKTEYAPHEFRLESYAGFKKYITIQDVSLEITKLTATSRITGRAAI